MEEVTTFVGLDVHKATIAVAVAVGGLREAAEFLGTIENTPQALAKLLAKLRRKHKHLSFCYEAGPCGYGVHRQLTDAGEACAVVAPALIPRRAADRVKTDRRDAISLAQLHRAGELRAIWVPDAAHEAMRDLVRARLVAVQSVRRARQQLSGFLLRHGCIYDGKTAWTRTYRRWLRACDSPIRRSRSWHRTISLRSAMPSGGAMRSTSKFACCCLHGRWRRW